MRNRAFWGFKHIKIKYARVMCKQTYKCNNALALNIPLLNEWRKKIDEIKQLASLVRSVLFE